MSEQGSVATGWVRPLPACALVTFSVLALFSPLLFAAKRGRLVLRPRKSREVPYSMTVVSPNDKGFDNLVNNYFSEATSASGYQAMRPYLALIRNNAPLSAVAYAVQWTVSYPGRPSHTLINFIVPRPLTGSPKPRIPPQGVRLISPKLNLWPTALLSLQNPRHRGAVSHLLSAGVGLTPQQYRGSVAFAALIRPIQYMSFAGAVSCTSEIVGVVFRGGFYSGTEGVQVLRRYVAARFAALDETRYVVRALDSSTPLYTLYQNLDQQVVQGTVDSGTTTMDMYIRARGRCALHAKSLLLNAGREDTLRRLLRIAPRARATRKVTVFGRAYQRRFGVSSGGVGPYAVK